jgi:hypothetical protein
MPFLAKLAGKLRPLGKLIPDGMDAGNECTTVLEEEEDEDDAVGVIATDAGGGISVRGEFLLAEP